MFDVVTIGTATRDAFIKSREFHIDHEPHVLGGKELAMPLGAKLEVEKIVFTSGGGATNTAVTFARQGLKTAAICVVGDDVSGHALTEELKAEKIATKFILARTGVPTGYSVLLHPEGGERTVLVYRGASETLVPRDIPWQRLQTKWLYLSSLAGNIALLRKIVSFAKSRNIPLAYNPGGKELKQDKKVLPFLRHTDILLVNRDEAALITGVSYRDEKKIFKKWDMMSPGINVMTDARNGVWVSDGKRLYKAGIYREKAIVDRTGAGDAFASGFTAGILRQSIMRKAPFVELPPEAVEYAIKLGSANATAKVEGIGPKYGLLTKRAFERDRRWRNLKITRQPL